MRLDQIVSEANQRTKAEVTPAPTPPERAPAATKTQSAPTIKVNQPPAPVQPAPVQTVATPQSTAAQAAPAYVPTPAASSSTDHAPVPQQFDHMPDADADRGLKAVRDDLLAARNAKIEKANNHTPRITRGYIALWAAMIVGGVGYLATIAFNADGPLAGRTAQLASQNAATRTQVINLQKSIEALQAKIKSAEAGAAGRSRELAALKATLEAMTTTQSELTARLVSLETVRSNKQPPVATPVATPAAKVKPAKPEPGIAGFVIQPRPVQLAPVTAPPAVATKKLPIPPAPVARKGPVPAGPPVRRVPKPKLTAAQKLEKLVQSDNARNKVSDRLPGATQSTQDALRAIKITPLPLQQPQIILPSGQ